MKKYLKKNAWKIIEDKYNADYNQISESIFSIGNGRMGQRATFEENYSGHTLQGSYIAGIYYPDKTKVGWWKNGYPEYFAKVLNSVNWIGIELEVNGKKIDLNKVEITDFSRELDMKNGLYKRRSVIKINDKTSLEIISERFYHYVNKDQTFLKYSIVNHGKKVDLKLTSSLDFDVHNQDSNYDESFWDFDKADITSNSYSVAATTKKTEFGVCAAQNTLVFFGNKALKPKKIKGNQSTGYAFDSKLKKDEVITLIKYTAICSTFYYPKSKLLKKASNQVEKASKKGYDEAKTTHVQAWNKKWEEMDVTITGDVAAQQGIRYNIFQLHQTYTGDDARLNIGPKGFTGEKYGGSTYWDTEAYCLPFYLSTASPEVSKNLLEYRHNHLPKAIENAEKLGFSKGAALYPMVTMNGEECHNEWEITFEEIHRNGAIAYAIYDYQRYTGDNSYLYTKGLDVLTAIARFWVQRVHWSEQKNAYVMLGVTGPNEYENNVDNNWYTNYIAKWCLEYTLESLENLKESNAKDHKSKVITLDVKLAEIKKWKDVADNIFLPSSAKHGIFLQQENYLDKEQILVADLPSKDRPINQKWSWDRILRSPFIKQADVLQGLYFFEENFTKLRIKKNFDYYEPRTVHESSLSPCVHSILACSLGYKEKAYEMYLRTSRLDLDDYNNDTEDGLHITSMAGSWLSVIKGFAGMRVKNEMLSFNPFLPPKWDAYSFKIMHRGNKIKVDVLEENVEITNIGTESVSLMLFSRKRTIAPGSSINAAYKK